MALNEDIMYHVMQFMDEKNFLKCTVLNKTLYSDIQKVKHNNLEDLPENYWTAFVKTCKMVFDQYAQNNRKTYIVRVYYDNGYFSFIRQHKKYSVNITKNEVLCSTDRELVHGLPKKADFQTVIKYIAANEGLITRMMGGEEFMSFSTVIEVIFAGTCYEKGYIVDILTGFTNQCNSEMDRREVLCCKCCRYEYYLGYEVQDYSEFDKTEEKDEIEDIDEIESIQVPPPPTAEIEVHNQWVQEMREAQQEALSEISYEE